MDMIQWTGTPKKREERRAQLIGKAWMSAWRADPGKWANWIPVFRQRTRLGYRWLWAPEYLTDTKYDESRAQVAGDSLLSGFADGSLSVVSAYWFNAAAKPDYWVEGWLFDEECLCADGWVKTTGRTANGKTWQGWRHKPGS